MLIDAAAPVSGLGVTHDLTRVANRLQVAGDYFIERRSLRARDLDDAVARRRERHIGNAGGDVVRRDRLEQAGRKPDDVSVRTCIGNGAEEFQELGRADDGVGDAGATRSGFVRARCESFLHDPAAELAIKERHVLVDGLAANV